MDAISSIIALLLLHTAPLLTSATPDTLLVEERVFGTFQHATRLIVGPQGWIYVIDTDQNGLFLFQEPDGSPSFVGGYGWSPTTFDRPTGVATDGLSLFVSDFSNHRIQRYDRLLNYVSSFSTRDTDFIAARFGYPAGVALSRLGDLFILETENPRVLKFATGGRFERSFGGIDDQRAALKRPRKILIAPNDHVLVLETHCLLEFDYFGNYIRTIGMGILEEARGFDVGVGYAIVATRDSLVWFSDRGEMTCALALRSILSSTSITEVEDVALVRDLLYLLTPRKVVVFRLRSFE